MYQNKTLDCCIRKANDERFAGIPLHTVAVPTCACSVHTWVAVPTCTCIDMGRIWQGTYQAKIQAQFKIGLCLG